MGETLAAIRPGVVVAALALDWCLGEPPARLHPVVWMGSYLQMIGERIAPLQVAAKTGQLRCFTAGALAWLIGAAVTGTAAWWLQVQLAVAPHAWQVLGVAVLLKPLFAWRMLHKEVADVEVALGQSLEEGRQRLARIVSRDVRQLGEVQVRESGIEVLAENLNDSVIAPLFWFAMLGLPGVAVYRFANTADAMWGYLGARGGRDWTWAGKWAARADDILSWAPARLTALLLYAGSGAPPWSVLCTQAMRTPSPNSGWPMAAMGIRLDVRLGKPGVYELWPQGRCAAPADTRRALRRAARAVAAVALLAAGSACIELLLRS